MITTVRKDRKNWLFSTSLEGVKASVNLYSLIEIAQANVLELYAYLKRVCTELPNATSFDCVDALLPKAQTDKRKPLAGGSQ